MAQKTAVRVAAELRIRGVVQGVGFRPFVQRLARLYRLTGSVKNESGHVLILAEGRDDDVRCFMRELRENPPAGAVIESVEEHIAERARSSGEQDFVISASTASDFGGAMMSPDIAVCGDCLRELGTPGNPRYRNPFVSCASCGPRFSVAASLPYDRDNTSMKNFPMCPLCESQYADGGDRRCHAQTVCCNGCGPTLSFESRGAAAAGEGALTEAVSALKAGAILAVKGIGGYHFACSPCDETAVARLRALKGREDKPFAVLFPALTDIKKLCRVGAEETALLLSPARPIVLLDRLQDGLAAGVCGKSRYLGAFLPYTPLQHLLLRETGPLVMTSANVSSQPIVRDDGEMRRFMEAQADLSGILTHNREILRRVDDSVVAVVNKKTQFVRRARGYVPLPVRVDALEGCPSLLCCGAQQKSVVALTGGPLCYLSAELGDLGGTEALKAYRETIQDMAALFHLAPAAAVCDLHPDYASARHARDSGLPVIAVQHHFAHIASVLAEHNVTGRVIGVAFDGTGYGPDGTVWGGEFLVASADGFTRAGHLKTVTMLGGDGSVREGWKTASCLLADAGVECPNASGPEKLVRAALMSGVNTIRSSSMGRVFDAVSALLGICRESTYEGQGAVELESAAAAYGAPGGSTPAGGDVEPLPFGIPTEDGCFAADLAPCFAALADEKEKGVNPQLLALRFHRTVAELIADICGKIRADTGIATVCLSGGVFQNKILMETAVPALVKAGFEVLFNEKVPPNDGGISLGQALIAGRILKSAQGRL